MSQRRREHSVFRNYICLKNTDCCSLSSNELIGYIPLANFIPSLSLICNCFSVEQNHWNVGFKRLLLVSLFLLFTCWARLEWLLEQQTLLDRRMQSHCFVVRDATELQLGEGGGFQPQFVTWQVFYWPRCLFKKKNMTERLPSQLCRVIACYIFCAPVAFLPALQ